jgi:hypothetical protein
MSTVDIESKDPWTGRARPAFLYVMYAFVLVAIPVGMLSVFSPDAALKVVAGMKAWLDAIPDMMWGTFGTAYCGYTLSRSYEKAKGVAK